MRVGLDDALGVGHAHTIQHLTRLRRRFAAPEPPVVHRHLDELLPEGHRRIQRCHRLLIDHGDGTAAYAAQLLRRQTKQVAALKQDLASGDAAGFAQVTHDGERDGRFPAAGFADQSVRLAADDFQIEIDHCRYVPGTA